MKQLAAVLLLSASLFAATNAVKIGTLRYVGDSVTQYGKLSLFEVTLDASKVTAQALTFSDLAITAVMCPSANDTCTAAVQNLRGQGPTTTPVGWSWYGGVNGDGLVYALPFCNWQCSYVSAQLFAGTAFSFTLLNGEAFTAYAITTTVLSPLPGQLYLKPGQTAAIILKRNRQ